MSNQHQSGQGPGDGRQGFPFELKLLLAVIALGVLAMALKVTDIL